MIYFTLQNILIKTKTSVNKRQLIVGMSLALLFVAVLEIWALNRLSTFGEQIVRIEQSSSQLKVENQLLENRIAEKSSLKEISELSRSLGFASASKIQYLRVDAIAFNR